MRCRGFPQLRSRPLETEWSCPGPSWAYGVARGFSYTGLLFAGLLLFFKPTRLLLQKFVLPKPGQACRARSVLPLFTLPPGHAPDTAACDLRALSGVGSSRAPAACTSAGTNYKADGRRIVLDLVLRVRRKSKATPPGRGPLPATPGLRVEWRGRGLRVSSLAVRRGGSAGQARCSRRRVLQINDVLPGGDGARSQARAVSVAIASVCSRTCVAVVCSKDASKLTSDGGVSTAAAAAGNVLLQRLRASKLFTIEVVDDVTKAKM